MPSILSFDAPNRKMIRIADIIDLTLNIAQLTQFCIAGSLRVHVCSRVCACVCARVCVCGCVCEYVCVCEGVCGHACGRVLHLISIPCALYFAFMLRYSSQPMVRGHLPGGPQTTPNIHFILI